MGFTGSVLNVKGGVGGALLCSQIKELEEGGPHRLKSQSERERLERLQSPETTELQLKRLSAAQGGGYKDTK